MSDKDEILEKEEELLKKIEDCPSERCKEAMLDSLNKENSTSEKHE